MENEDGIEIGMSLPEDLDIEDGILTTNGSVVYQTANDSVDVCVQSVSEKRGGVIFDAPWAKDADGTEIKTVYSIDGNSLVQYVGFDENSAFPIVVDPKGKASIKDRYRGLLTTVAAIGESCGYMMAAKLLKHSLQDNPSNLKYDESSAFSKQIKKSSEYKNTVLPEIKKKLKNVSGSSYKTGYSNSVKLDSTTDLYMALNYSGDKYSAKKSNGK